MNTGIELSTDRDSLFLRELTSEADDIAYFAAIEANREHLSQFGDDTAANYPSLASVSEARLHPSNPDKLRLGIWSSEDFVGSINITPDNDDSAEIGYWLDARHTGQGYATLAAKALGQYGVGKYQRVYAEVVTGNEASSRVLERAGFHKTIKAIGRVTFELGESVKGTKVQHAATPQFERQDLDRFAEMPNRRVALRAKDKDNLTVFLSHAIAKKLYRCPCCQGNISIGTEHVILSRVQMSKRYNHHHVDFECTQRKILPTLESIQTVNPNETTASKMNARNRKYRNQRRSR